MLKATKFVTFCKAMIGQAYWYGTYGNKCTKALAKKKAGQYPDYYADYTTEELQDAIDKKKICMDCVGLVKCFFWNNGGDDVIAYINGTGDFETEYRSNGFPDTNANGLLEWCQKHKAKNGKMSTMPDIPGILLFRAGHVGVYVGGKYVVEAKGHNYGVVKTKLNKNSWLAWSYLPDWVLEYDTEESKSTIENIAQAITNIFKPSEAKGYSKGDKGSKVVKIQKMLIACGYTLGKSEPDGIFDENTEYDLKAFQTGCGLTADGVYGQETHEALMAAYNEVKVSAQSSNSGAPDKVVKVTGSRVNVRQEPSISSRSLGIVKRNDKLAYYGETTDGWHKILYKSQIAWISADYSEVI